MRPDGGEARRITDAKEGVVRLRVQPRRHAGSSIAAARPARNSSIGCRSTGIDSASAEQLTKHPTGVGTWQWAPDSKRIYFVTPDTIDADEKLRREKKFTVNIRNPETPVVEPVGARPRPRAAPSASPTDGAYSVDDFTISDDGKWIGFRGLSPNRYKRNITQQNLYADLYLLEAATGHDRAADEERRSRRKRPQLLARQHSGSRSRRRTTSTTLQHDATAASTCARSRDRGKPFRKLGDDVRRRRHASASGRRTAARSTSTRASRRPTSSWRSTSQQQHGAASSPNEKAVALGRPGRRHRRAADQLHRRHDAADAVHRRHRSTRSPARARRGGS